MRDLTVGKPSKVLVQYALPLFGSIIFQQLYNIADSFVAGRYIGTFALAAVGNSYEITLVYIALAFGLNIGVSVVVAGYYGAKRMEDMKTAVYTALLFCVALGVALTALGECSSAWLLRLIRTPEEVFSDSLSYLEIYIAGFGFLLFYNVSTGVFSALGDSQTPFWFLAVSSVSNILMDILFVKSFGLGVPGVAYATFLCQGVSALAALLTVLHKVRGVHSEKARLFSGHVLRKILRVAIPSALQQGFISVGNIIIQSVINGFGTAVIGGYAAAIKLNNMTITSITALGSGMSNYTAQNLGAGKPERVHSGVQSGALLACAIAAAFMGAYWMWGGALTGLFISDGNAQAIRVGTQFLRIVSPFYCVVALKLVVDGVLRGASRMAAFMSSTLTDLALRVAASILLSQALGITGVWFSWPLGWCVATALSYVFYRGFKKKGFQA